MSSELLKVLSEADDIVEELKSRFDYKNNDVIVAFRGESRDFKSTALTPSLFRDKLNDSSKELQLLDLLKDFKISEGDFNSNLSRFIDSQHYLSYSRLLDITFNILPSIYFACEDYYSNQEIEDAIIYIFCFPDYYSPHSAYLNEYFNAILNNDSNLYHGNFNVITNNFLNDRIKAQNGGFILFPSESFYKIPEIFYKKLRIKSDSKKDILIKLNKMFNISKATMYPEKDKRSEYIKNQIRYKNEIIRKFTVSSEVQKYITFLKKDINYFLDSVDTNENKMIIEKLRYLRKSKYDLVGFIDKSNSDEKEELKEFCFDEFKLLEMLLKGVMNEKRIDI